MRELPTVAIISRGTRKIPEADDDAYDNRGGVRGVEYARQFGGTLRGVLHEWLESSTRAAWLHEIELLSRLRGTG